MPTVYRRITGGQWDSTVDGPDVQVEIYAVDAIDMSPSEWNASMAKDLPDVPKKGEAHPDRPELFCQSVRIDPTGPYSAEAICVFSEPSGSVIYTPKEFYRVSWRGGSETETTLVDSKGKNIGSLFYHTAPPTANDQKIQKRERTYKNGDIVNTIMVPWVDDSAPTLGAVQEVGALYCSVSLPLLDPTDPNYVAADINLFNSLQNTVNSQTMKIGHMLAPAGWVKYLAFDADENGPKPNMYSITHHFRIGVRSYEIRNNAGGVIQTSFLPNATPEGFEQGILFQDQVLTLRREKIEPDWWAGLPADLDPEVKAGLKDWWEETDIKVVIMQQVARRTDLSVLLPATLHP